MSPTSSRQRNGRAERVYKRASPICFLLQKEAGSWFRLTVPGLSGRVDPGIFRFDPWPGYSPSGLLSPPVPVDSSSVFTHKFFCVPPLSAHRLPPPWLNHLKPISNSPYPQLPLLVLGVRQKAGRGRDPIVQLEREERKAYGAIVVRTSIPPSPNLRRTVQTSRA